MLLILAGIEQNPGPKMSKQTTLETTLDRDKDIKDLINALTKRLDSWGERLESRLSAIDDRVENINQRLQQLEESSAVTKATLSQNSKKIKDLEDQLEHLDAKSRERNLIFYGIEQDNNEDCRERIRKVIEENMQTTEKINITRCHRLSRKPGAPILIEVPEQNDRLTLFKAALNLRGTKISLSKDYSMKMREQRRVLNVKRRELVEKETLVLMNEAYEKLSRTQFWYKRFKDGRKSIADDLRLGRPLTSTTDRNIGQWKLLHDNAPAHRAIIVQDYLAKHSVSVLPHPPYSPDITPCDFFFFPKLKMTLKGRRFSSSSEVIDNVRAKQA
ncbi:hypothetical protein LAZ67_1005533 [Cordylochernes scorpioides]|uniref:Transposase n=1 Tax=Cordylochernes scorpioides TaxID=51811 RepID=A0ABY6K1A8_9ARAC|nr:hypothetical protein LAZ67_1005533 [Cordylochernes scorpioides]